MFIFILNINFYKGLGRIAATNLRWRLSRGECLLPIVSHGMNQGKMTIPFEYVRVFCSEQR